MVSTEKPYILVKIRVAKFLDLFTYFFRDVNYAFTVHTVSQKNWATLIFTVILANSGRFLTFFHCRNQKLMAHNKNEKFLTVD